PYKHPRSTGTTASSGGALPDGWMNFVLHHSTDDAIGSVEHQVLPAPFVNTGFADEAAVGGDAFRKRLWNSTMAAEYPTALLDTENLDAVGAKALSVWSDFFAKNRFWELEPFFDVDGGRAVALPGIEYVVYIEKPGPVEVLVEKHGYDVIWFNPLTGEATK